MNITFCNKRALVTGAASGIGKGIAVALAKCGARVIAVDYSQEQLEKLKEDIPLVEMVLVDLSNWQQTKEKLKGILPVDLLVNCAGIAIIEPISQITEASIDKTFAINLKALVNVTQTVVDDWLQKGTNGTIVNISSQASQAALLNHGLYCASKGAVDAFTRAIALELGPKNIRVNCVNPTVVMTELGKKVWSDPALGGPMLAKIPLKRFAEVEDVVNVVLYLLSDKASMITGTCLPVDGGFLAT